jgi:hypothetical protein
MVSTNAGLLGSLAGSEACKITDYSTASSPHNLPVHTGTITTLGTVLYIMYSCVARFLSQLGLRGLRTAERRVSADKMIHE